MKMSIINKCIIIIININPIGNFHYLHYRIYCGPHKICYGPHKICYGPHTFYMDHMMILYGPHK